MLEFFVQFPELVAVMSEKEDGSMKLFKKGFIEKQNQKNRKKFFEKIGIREESVVMADLVHGNSVEIVKNSEIRAIAETDGLITKEKDLFLAVTVADCVPIFFYEKERGIVALVHAGWRGILENIINKIAIEISQYGGKIENLQVALGPGINECHYEIKNDVVDNFGKYSEFVFKKNEKIFVDLKQIIKKQLLEIGVKKGNIENNSSCTHCSKKLFSFRRDKPEITEAMIALIGFKKSN